MLTALVSPKISLPLALAATLGMALYPNPINRDLINSPLLPTIIRVPMAR